jgi:hypothetical protein
MIPGCPDAVMEISVKILAFFIAFELIDAFIE